MKGYVVAMIAALLLTGMASSVVADIIILKDGGTLSGNLVSVDADQVVIASRYTETRVDRDQVAAIHFFTETEEAEDADAAGAAVEATGDTDLEVTGEGEAEGSVVISDGDREDVGGQQTLFGNTLGYGDWLTGTVYYLPRDVDGIPALDSLREAGNLYTPTLNIEPQSLRSLSPVTYRHEWFAIIYKGYIVVDSEDDYVFELTSDDGSLLYLDDVLVVDNNGRHPPQSRRGTVHLAEGRHRIRVDYFQAGGADVALTLKGAREGLVPQVVDTTRTLGHYRSAGSLF